MPSPEPLPEVFRARFATLEEQFLTKERAISSPSASGAVPSTRSGYACGATTTYLDEILSGAAVRATERLSVTGEITVRFVKPVPLETPLPGRGCLTARAGRYVDVEGSLEELATFEVLARARGRFFFQDRSASAAPPVPGP